MSADSGSENAGVLSPLHQREKKLFDAREIVRRRVQNLSRSLEASVEAVENLEVSIRFCETALTQFEPKRVRTPEPAEGRIHSFLTDLSRLPEFQHVKLTVLAAFGRPAFHPLVSHSFSVAVVAESLYSKAGLERKEHYAFCLGALMHDLGMSLLPPLNQTDPLAAEKREAHTTLGQILLEKGGSRSHELGAEIARNHHEKWNGTGFPDHLSGTLIPVTARIVSICDVFDGLMTRIEKGESHGPGAVCDALEKGRSILFDPELTSLFVQNFDEMLELRQHARQLAVKTLVGIEEMGRENT